MKVLFVGDVYGGPGRRIINEQLPLLAPRFDFVIVNAENSAGGFGVHFDAALRLLEAGADCLTLGNHAWDHKDVYKLMEQPDKFPIVRPLNYSAPDTPGVGWRTFEVGGERLTVVNLLGRVFMGESANPFTAMDTLLERDDLGSVFVDFHAETTSEKAAMGWHLDGRVAAVIGTHTHVPTADTRILPKGTGFQTDSGLTGPYNSVIGARIEEPLQAFVTERRHRFQMGEGPAVLNAVELELSGGRCLNIHRYQYIEAEED